jgi:hypothetical protein
MDFTVSITTLKYTDILCLSSLLSIHKEKFDNQKQQIEEGQIITMTKRKRTNNDQQNI